MSRPISFQEKFKDRIGVIGKEGIVGMVKQTDNQIQGVARQDSNSNKLNEWSDIYNRNQGKNSLASNGNMIVNSSKPNNIPSSNFNPQTGNFPQMNAYQNAYMPQPYQAPYMGYPQQGYMPNNNQPHPMMYNNPLFQPYYNGQFPPQNNYYSNPMMMPNNMNYGSALPMLNNNQYPQNPVKVIPVNSNSETKVNESKSVVNMNNRDRMRLKQEGNVSQVEGKNQRSFSSKPKYDKANSSNVNHADSSQLKDKERAQNTHPDSFSRQNNKSMARDDGSFHKPYTLKDYKELTSAKIVLGGLGPNIGTKEWEEKSKKMKKIAEYAENVKATHHVALKPIKENPVDIVERERKEKIDASTRNKAAEYAKKLKKIKITKYNHDLIYDHGPYSQNNYKNEFEGMMNNEAKNKVDLNEFDELQKKREFLAQQVNAFKDDILK